MAHFTRSHGAAFAQNLPLPPFSNWLNPATRNTLAVLTGSHAWTRAKSPSWCAGRRLVLPLGKEPEAYRWPVSGRDCTLFGFGEAEPRERLVRLSLALLAAGSPYVTWCGQWAMTAVYADGTSDARLIPDAVLSQMPAPIFRAGGAQ